MNKSFSVIIISLLTVFTIKTFKNPFVYFSLVLLAPITIVKIDKDLTFEDYLESLGNIGKDFRSVWGKSSFQGAKTFFNNPSDSLTTFFGQALKPVQVDFSWFSKFREKSQLVVGVSGDGKTTYQLDALRHFLENNPNGKVSICDLDYMMSHGDSLPNDWFGLPKAQYIKCDYESIRDEIIKFSKLIDDRNKQVKDLSREDAAKVSSSWDKALLMVDEIIAIHLESKDRGEDKELSPKIKNILNRGLKARVFCMFGAQNMSVTDIGISTAAQDSFNIILLGSCAKNPEYLKKIDCQGKEQQEILGRLAEMRKIFPYSAIIRVKQDVKVVTLPEFDTEGFRYSDPFEDWKTKTFTDTVYEALAEYAGMMVEDETLTLDAPYDLCFADDSQKQKEVKRIIESFLKKPIDNTLNNWWNTFYTLEKAEEWKQKAIKWKSSTKEKSPWKDILKDAKIHTKDQKAGNPRFDKVKKTWLETVESISSN